MDCEGCPSRPVASVSAANAAAIKIWQALDAWGRGLDTFGGLPLPLRLEALRAECDRADNPEGMRWRVEMIEEIVFTKRLARFRDDAEKREREGGNGNGRRNI